MRTITSLTKGIKILEFLAESHEGVKLSEISKVVSMPSSNLSLFLNTLIESGYAIKNPTDNKYYVSNRLVEIANLIRPNRYMRLLSVSKPEIERIHAIFDENVILAVVNNYQLYLISRLQSTKSIQIVHNDGPFIPHVTAGGKVVLACLTETQLAEYFKKTEWKSFTSQSMTEKELVLKQLEVIREKGYAINRGEYEEEIMAIAAPIFENEQVIAALIVQFPTFRYREEELYDKAPEVIATAKRIGKLLKQK